MPRMRRSTFFFALILALAAGAAGLLGVHPALERRGAAEGLAGRRQLVRELGLTDLCLFTEAGYTRHPSQADRHAAFQDHPMALEHFPSGGLLPPPTHLRTWGHAVD